MTEQTAAAAAPTPAAAQATTPAQAPAAAQTPAPAQAPADKRNVLRGLLGRIASGEFDPGHKDFHQFVVKEIYPLLGAGTLTVEDLERITKAYSVRADPYNKDEG